MTDSEILRAVGISSFLYDNPSNSLRSMLIKAMAQARADERVQVGSDIQIAIVNGDYPHICEGIADFVVKGK